MIKVIVYERKTGAIVDELEAFDMRDALNIRRGIFININLAEYFVRIEDSEIQN